LIIVENWIEVECLVDVLAHGNDIPAQGAILIDDDSAVVAGMNGEDVIVPYDDAMVGLIAGFLPEHYHLRKNKKTR